MIYPKDFNTTMLSISITRRILLIKKTNKIINEKILYLQILRVKVNTIRISKPLSIIRIFQAEKTEVLSIPKLNNKNLNFFQGINKKGCQGWKICTHLVLN